MPSPAPSFAARGRRAVAAAFGAVSLLFATGRSARAQAPDAPLTATLRFDAAGTPAFTSPWGSPDVGRLQATFLSLPGEPSANRAVDVFCVDLLHNVTFDPAGWQVYLTNLGGTSVAYTRQGARTFDAAPDALTRYRKAAWLVDQYASVTSRTDTAGIQGAMWLQFAGSLSPYDYATEGEAEAVATWRGAADAFAASAAFGAYDWGRFTVLTDVHSAGLGEEDRGLQELITHAPPVTTTPEPATVVLVGAGLAGAAAAARRRSVG